MPCAPDAVVPRTLPDASLARPSGSPSSGPRTRCLGWGGGRLRIPCLRLGSELAFASHPGAGAVLIFSVPLQATTPEGSPDSNRCFPKSASRFVRELKVKVTLAPNARTRHGDGSEFARFRVTSQGNSLALRSPAVPCALHPEGPSAEPKKEADRRSATGRPRDKGRPPLAKAKSANLAWRPPSSGSGRGMRPRRVWRIPVYVS